MIYVKFHRDMQRVFLI